jgi:hypothetical protein
MDTGATNFMAGMAQVQAMQQAQEAHEQQLQQNEVKMTLAQADNERADRAMKIKEQEAYQKSVAFDADVATGRARVSTWNGKDRPSWASAQLGAKYDSLSSLHSSIRSKQRKGVDASADILAFQAMMPEYDQQYQAEVGQRRLSNEIGALETIYERTGLEPDNEVMALIGEVQSNTAGLGYTSAQLSPDQRAKVSEELARARKFAEEFDVRLGLKTDLDSMREIVTSLRAGRAIPGMDIPQEVITELQKIRLQGGEYDDDEGLGFQVSPTLYELVQLLDSTSNNAIDAWDPEQDIAGLQDKLQQAKGLLDIVGSAPALKYTDMQKQVSMKLEQERTNLLTRTSTAGRVRSGREAIRADLIKAAGGNDSAVTMRMSPYDRWQQLHDNRTSSTKFDLDYDNDDEYMTAWSAVTQRAELTGLPVEDAAVQLNAEWHAADQVRQRHAELDRKLRRGQKDRGESGYWQSLVDDVLASERQLEGKYSSSNAYFDRIVNNDGHHDRVSTAYIPAYNKEALQQEISDAEINVSFLSNPFSVDTGQIPVRDYTMDPAAAMKRVRIRMLHESGTWEMGEDYQASKALGDALEAVGIDRAEYFGLTTGAMSDGFFHGTFLDNPDIPLEFENKGFSDYARKYPKKAAELAHALQVGAEQYKKSKQTSKKTRPATKASAPAASAPAAIAPATQPRSTGPENAPVSMDRYLGEAPTSQQEEYAKSMRGDVARRALSGDIPSDAMLTSPSGRDQGDLPAEPRDAMPRRVEAFELADLGGDYGPGQRVDASSIYADSSRTQVGRASEDPIYATAQRNANRYDKAKVETMIADLMDRRRKSGDGKLSRKDAAMLAALIERQRKLQGRQTRRPRRRD